MSTHTIGKDVVIDRDTANAAAHCLREVMTRLAAKGRGDLSDRLAAVVEGLERADTLHVVARVGRA